MSELGIALIVIVGVSIVFSLIRILISVLITKRNKNYYMGPEDYREAAIEKARLDEENYKKYKRMP